MKITQDPNIRALLPPLTTDELARLDAKLLAEGNHEQLPCWEQGNLWVLLDGHHRRDLLLKRKESVDYRPMKFLDRTAAIQWVIDNQLARRNLTDERRAYYIGKTYISTMTGADCQRGSLPTNSVENVAEQIGEKHGVSARTVYRNADFAEAVDTLPEKEKEQILNGQAEQSKAEIIQKYKPAKTAKSKPKKEAKSGSAIWDDREFPDLYGKIVRWLDRRSDALGTSKHYDDIREHLDKVMVCFKRWQLEKK